MWTQWSISKIVRHELYEVLGDCYYKLNKKELAIKNWQNAIESNSEFGYKDSKFEDRLRDKIKAAK